MVPAELHYRQQEQQSATLAAAAAAAQNDASGGICFRCMEVDDATPVRFIHEQCLPVRYNTVSLAHTRV